jgi:hypothetical protein
MPDCIAMLVLIVTIAIPVASLTALLALNVWRPWRSTTFPMARCAYGHCHWEQPDEECAVPPIWPPACPRARPRTAPVTTHPRPRPRPRASLPPTLVRMPMISSAMLMGLFVHSERIVSTAILVSLYQPATLAWRRRDVPGAMHPTLALFAIPNLSACATFSMARPFQPRVPPVHPPQTHRRCHRPPLHLP